MRVFALSVVLLNVLSLPAFAQVSAPAAPQVTVGAGLKLLQFDWNDVPDATSYVLQIKPDANSPFAPHGEPIPAPRSLAALYIPVHGLDWVNARYKVSACNAAGCTDSAEIAVTDLMLDSIGYLKASNPDAADAFGRYFDLSKDGNTLVVSAEDDSAATGVNGDQADNSTPQAGAVYVFRRIGARWRQVAYLKPDVAHVQQYFGIGFPMFYRAVSVSNDGSLVAVGAPGDTDTWAAIGAVYLFARAADGSYSQQTKVTLPDAMLGDYFGVSVEISGDGTVLRASALRNQSPTTFVFRRSGTTWALETSFPPQAFDTDCNGQLSNNGQVIISICNNFNPAPRLYTWRRVGNTWQAVPFKYLTAYWIHTPALSGNGTRLALRGLNALGHRVVDVFAWNGSAWALEQTIASAGGSDADRFADRWGESMAFNQNGTVLAISDYENFSGGTGVSDSPQPPASPASKDGAVFLYSRGSGTSPWTLTKVVKAPNAQAGDGFGRAVSLSGNGVTLAVGAPDEDSKARGIDGNQANNALESAGAVYLY